MAKSKKKIVRNFSVNALFAGAVLFAPVMVADLNAAPIQTNQVTWTTIEQKSDRKGSKESGQIILDSYKIQKSNTGQTRKVRTSYQTYKYNSKQQMTYMDSWKYDQNGNPKEKFVTKYVEGTSAYDYQKNYKWAKPGQGSSYLDLEVYYNRPDYDITRKEYNSSGYLTEMNVFGKGDSSITETTYTRNSKNVLTKKAVNFRDGDGKLKRIQDTYYYGNGTTRKELRETHYNQNGVKTKYVYNSFHTNGKRKVAQDTYFTNGTTKKSMKENQYNNKGVKTKYIVNEFHSNGKKKLVRDTYYYTNGKTIKETRENQYNTKGVRTKNILNTFHTNGKKKLARDTYYYGNGKTRKELKENHYDSKGKRTKNVLNQWYSNGKPKLYKDTYYKSNGKVKEVRQTSFSTTGKKKTTIKKY